MTLRRFSLGSLGKQDIRLLARLRSQNFSFSRYHPLQRSASEKDLNRLVEAAAPRSARTRDGARKPRRRARSLPAEPGKELPTLLEELRRYYERGRQRSEWVYTQKDLLLRESIRFDPGIAGILSRFWRVTDEEGLGRVSKAEYLKFHNLLYKALNKHFDAARAAAVAEEDWELDSGAHDELNADRFRLSLFEMADAWAGEVTAGEYARVLEIVFERITYLEVGPRGTRRRLRYRALEEVAAGEAATVLRRRLKEAARARAAAPAPAPPPPAPRGEASPKEGAEGPSRGLSRVASKRASLVAGAGAAPDPARLRLLAAAADRLAATPAPSAPGIKRLARGMSDYQACWIPDELSEGEEAEASDAGDGHDDARMSDAGSDAKRSDDAMEAEDGGGGDAASADDDNDEYKDKDDNRVELDPDVQLVPDHVQFDVETQARMRFGRYRGLKSMRSSPWDPKENLPLDFGRIFHFEHFSRTRQHALKLAQEHIVPAGTWVTLHVADFPAARVAELDLRRGPVVVGALLQHENRTSVLNFLVTKSPSCDAPVPNKEVLEVHCGWRRFDASCLFSQHTPNADKHKMEKELPASGHSVVTVFGPITYPPSPVLLFKRDASGVRTLVASGSLSSVDADRIILKKIVLCGHVFRIHKSRAVVRHMFFNPEDIKWFTPVQLWTKNGRIGHIREPLGTHGYMKCQFDAQLRQDDVVCMSLYKRVFPKWPKPAAS